MDTLDENSLNSYPSTLDDNAVRRRSQSTNYSVDPYETDHDPLVVSDKVMDLMRSLSHTGDPYAKLDEDDVDKSQPRRTLGWIGGVFAAVALAQFSTNLFLRVGFVVGQSGILLTLVQFALAYSILYMTILSICAISTNGAVEGGGAYYMISRALGPEFGGSIGALFFLANVFSCALYVSGFVEGLINNFGPQGLPHGGGWWSYLYASAVLLLCLIVCIIGGAMFARTSVFILFIVVVCTLSVVLSMFVQQTVIPVPCPPENQPDHNTTWLLPGNGTPPEHYCGNYTGLSMQTFTDNMFANYTKDYVTKNPMNFATVFAILFSSVTGIMNGANMSGELKDPSKAIPKGTLAASTFTLGTYIIIALLTAATCSRELLVNNYNYLQYINLWHPFVIIGIFSATLSAALGNLIGGSRILEALARDHIFWRLLTPATWTTRGGNPIPAVLLTWVLVQAVLLIGSLNAIAPMTSVLFLLSYAATNLACLALELASAPNFRPTFKYFSAHTAVLGLAGCLVMTFLISYVYALSCLICLIILVIALHLRSFETSWGSISQALLFHQVRKYLLMLDTRKDHVKFWRPQMLLLVSNPLASCDLIDFINDIKKGGLYVLGHVEVGHFESERSDSCSRLYTHWMSFVDHMKIKAFIEVTMAPSIREGMQHLVRISGLGGMKPNTICFGFYDSALPVNTLITRGRAALTRKWYTMERGMTTAGIDELCQQFPAPRGADGDKALTPTEYLHMVHDAIKMNKNVCLFRGFHNLNKTALFQSKQKKYIDVWPVNLFRPETSNIFDNTCLFLLQLACILHMVPGWSRASHLRVFMCSDSGETDDNERKKKKLAQVLKQLRILGEIQTVSWDHVTCLLGDSSGGGSGDAAATSSASESVQSSQYQQTTGMSRSHREANLPELSDQYLTAMNELLTSHSRDTAVTFLYLPSVPKDTGNLQLQYLRYLERLTRDLPPTVLVYGIHPVTSTTL